MNSRETAIESIALEALQSSSNPMEAALDVALHATGNDLTPHGVAETARAIGHFSQSELSTNALRVVVKAAVNARQAHDSAQPLLARRKEIAQLRNNAAAHIRNIQARH